VAIAFKSMSLIFSSYTRAAREISLSFEPEMRRESTRAVFKTAFKPRRRCLIAMKGAPLYAILHHNCAKPKRKQ
jgi:hypothetical protein